MRARAYNKFAKTHGFTDVIKLMDPRNLEDQRLAMRNGLTARANDAKGLGDAALCRGGCDAKRGGADG